MCRFRKSLGIIGNSPKAWYYFIHMNDSFRRVAHKVGESAGSPKAFLVALAVILAWVMTGPYFHYSDTWQLVINTGTTIVTFLMVFLIQNMQNRDSKALHLKMDEIIRSIEAARDDFIDLEEMTDKQLSDIETEFRKIHTDKLNQPK